MKGIVVLLFACLLVVVYCKAPPSATNVGLPTATTFNLIKAVGAGDLTTAGSQSGGPAANNFGTVRGLSTVLSGLVPQGPFQQGGVVVADTVDERGLLFSNTINTPGGTAASVVFGQSSFTDGAAQSGFGDPTNPTNLFLSSYQIQDAIVFASARAVYVFNITQITFNTQHVSGNPAQFPITTLGTCSTCNYPAIGNQFTLGLATGINKIYYSVGNCILVWNLDDAASRGNNANVANFIGQSSASACSSGASTCGNDNVVPSTCINAATVMAVDCRGDLWVYNAGTSSLLHFPSTTGAYVADYAMAANWGSNPPTSISFGSGTRCGYMAVSTLGLQYVFSVTYSGSGVPTVTPFTAFGSSKASSVSSSSDSIAGSYALTWDVNSPDYMFVADINGNRVVYLSPFGTSAATQSLVPSNSPTPTRTPTTTSTPTPSQSRTPSATTSASITPSSSVSRSNGASFSKSPSPSMSLSFGVSPTPTLSDLAPSPGSASSLCSWYSLLF